MNKIIYTILLMVITFNIFGQDTLKVNLIKKVDIVSIRPEQSTPITQTFLNKGNIDIKNIGQDMSYILQSTPSITNYSDNGLYNSYTYFRLRGVDQTRINMTLNGIPLNEPEDQGVYFSNYPDFASNLNSVQIQRGVGSSSYGSSSYIGSINFEGPNLLDSNWTSVEAGYGSYNSKRLSIGYNSGIQNKIGIYCRYSMINSDGYRYNSFNDSRTFFTSIGYYGNKNIIKLTSFSGQSNNGMAYLATNIDDINIDPRTNYLSSNEQDKFNQNLISIQWISNLNSNSNLNTSIFYNQLDGNYDILFSDTIISNNDLFKFRLKSNFYGLMTTYSYLKNNFKLKLGANVNFYDRSHMMSNFPNFTDYIYKNKGIKNEISSFVKLNYDLSSSMLFYFDIQYRYVSFNYVPDVVNKIDMDNINWSFLNPKGGIRINKSKKTSYYLSIGMNHREPTRNDLFNGFDDIVPISKNQYVGFETDTININSIKPERVVDVEAGVEFKFKKIFTHLNLYYMNFKNEIAQIGQISYIGLPLRKNVDKSFRSGIELDLNWRPIHNLLISSSLNYSYNKIKQYTAEFNSTTYKNVSPILTPNLIINSSITYNYKIVSFGLSGRYVSKSYLDNTQNEDFITPSFFLVDTHVHFLVKNIGIKFIINNILNERYYTSGYVGFNGVNSTPAYYIGAPRNYYLSLSYKF